MTSIVLNLDKLSYRAEFRRRTKRSSAGGRRKVKPHKRRLKSGKVIKVNPTLEEHVTKGAKYGAIGGGLVNAGAGALLGGVVGGPVGAVVGGLGQGAIGTVSGGIQGAGVGAGVYGGRKLLSRKNPKKRRK
jgi:hypothetical protein